MSGTESPTDQTATGPWIDGFSDDHRLLLPEYRVLRDRFESWRRLLTALTDRCEGRNRLPDSVNRCLQSLQRIADVLTMKFAVYFEALRPAVEPDTIRRLLMHGERTLHRCEAHVAAIDVADAAVDTMVGLLHDLLLRPHAEGKPLSDLVERLLQTAEQQSNCWTFFDAASANKAGENRWTSDLQRLPARSRNSVPEILQSGIASAQIAAQLAGPIVMMTTTQRKSVITASLLQDIGFVLLERRFRCTPRELLQIAPDEFARHPRFSAALAEGITGLSVDVLQAIGGHHQRQKTGRAKPDGVSQAVAVVARFRDLYAAAAVRYPAERLRTMNDSHGSHPAITAAHTVLQSESRAGDWNADLCRALETALQHCIAPVPLLMETDGEKLPGRVVASEIPPVPAPHFLAESQRADSVKRTNADTSGN